MKIDMDDTNSYRGTGPAALALIVALIDHLQLPADQVTAIRGAAASLLSSDRDICKAARQIVTSMEVSSSYN